MKSIERYIVVCKWIESYENPIILKKDEKVVINLAIKETDPEWVNWVWCIADNGMTGWVPIQILNVYETLPNERQIAIVLEDYSAYELPVNQDEIVIGSRCLNGWLWCRKENSTKKGWVPIRCLKRSVESL
ncbi:MAG: hypothetical protein EGP82_10810 [Odoribacter splanchnicus]|nr:hypothetical protein [Odoribacter splanchnicus]